MTGIIRLSSKKKYYSNVRRL